MRQLRVLALLAFLVPSLVALDADARRRRGKKRSRGPHPTAVAPFDGDASGGYAIAEALSLELELVETVIISGDRWLRADLRKLGRDGYERPGLRKVMKRRKIDILIRGRTRGGKLEVYVFGKDGRPRFVEAFPLVDDPDDSARAIAEAITPVLKRWRRARPVPMDPDAGRRPVTAEPEPEPEPEPESGGDEVDLFVDFDDEGNPVEPTELEEPDGGGMPRGDADPAESRRVRFDDDPADVADPPEREGGRRILLDPDDDEDSGDDGEEERSRLRFDDDAGDDDAFEEERPRVTMADVEDEDGERIARVPWLTASGGFQLSGWQYNFSGVNPAHDLVLPMLFNYGGAARVSVFPIEYVGVEAFGSGSYFSVDASAEPVRPQNLNVIGYGGGIGVRGRFPFKFGDLAIAPGARLGYRLWGANVPTQTSEEDSRGLTLVPGWTMHAAAIGLDVLVTYVIAKRWRLEVEARVDPMPLVFYVETPDNPGGISRPLAGAGTLMVRVPVWDPVFVELFGNGIVARTVWEERGTRVSANDYDAEGNRVAVEGGEGLNLQVGGGIAVGVSF